MIRQNFTHQSSHVTQRMALLKIFKPIKSEKELVKEQVKDDLKRIRQFFTRQIRIYLEKQFIKIFHRQ